MKSILCFGEMLIDFLHVRSTSEGSFSLPEFRQYPGGAPANVAAAIGRLGGPARMLGQVGADRFGAFLTESLSRLGVDTRFVGTHPAAPTPLAYVFLDEDGERHFEFMRRHSADVVMTGADCPEAAFEGIGLFHFCSNTLTDPDIATTTRHAIQCARAAGAPISFDVNLRHNLWPEGEADPDVIRRFMSLADLIKVSREERDWIESNGYPLEQWLSSAQAIWVTDGGGRIVVHRGEGVLDVAPPEVRVVDTTAGGDAFTGGLLLALMGRHPAELDNDTLRAVTEFAAGCGGVAVSRAGALPSLPDWEDVAALWPHTWRA